MSMSGDRTVNPLKLLREALLSGADPDDSQRLVNQVTINNLIQYFSNLDSGWQVIVLKVAVDIMNSMMHFIMGADKLLDSKGRARRPGTMAKAQQAISIKDVLSKLNEVRNQFYKLLTTWNEPGNLCTDLLRAVGYDTERVDIQAFARRHACQMDAGAFRRLELTLGQGVALLWPLATSSACGDVTLNRVSHAFLKTPDHCLSSFAKQVRANFPDMEHLRSYTCGAFIETWLLTLIWSIYAAEREHNLMRKILDGGQSQFMSERWRKSGHYISKGLVWTPPYTRRRGSQSNFPSVCSRRAWPT